MSVINNVLKDLESRESHFTPIEITSVTPPPSPRRDPKSTAVVVMLILLLAAGGWIYLQRQSDSGTATPASLPANEARAIVAAKADSGAVAAAADAKPATTVDVDKGVVTDQLIGNQIIGLQIRESEQDMQLEFVLRDRVVAYLKQRSANSFSFHLREVESQIVAPIISDNRWITNLTITTYAAGVDIEFETASEILVETRQNLVDGETVWAINLRKAVPRAVDVAVVTETVASVTPATESSPDAVAPGESAVQPTLTATAAIAEPQAPVARQPASEVKLEIKSTNPNIKSANQLEYATELINSRRYADAESLFQGLLGGVEDHAARKHLLALYISQQRNDRYHRLARESAEKYADDPVFRTEYGRTLFQQADYRAVIQLLGAESGLDSGQQALVAGSYQRLDQHADAIRHYQLAIELDASDAKSWIGLGISQEQTAKLEAALDSYQRAGRLGNMNSRLRAFVDRRSKTLKQVLN